ncbi:hypothetical protein J0B03_05325 [Alkalibacter rhizosphaerae]|uniref:Uncharacterized protein n=1 Tax=Alkalibacter rhizosphaerae TaxID=2815577 RepID=A0A974XGX3_9FIRM|nr:hypothetical protein [Alkalibacter rhizosphaerae]QSX09486.1 hypothetical protein J0B03_05325 [Alkalibacter rhizosphaerae]
MNRDDTTTDPNPNLPMLTIDTEFAGGMGFEGYMAYDISDLTNANPWNEDMSITHLPVIKNKFAYDEMQHVEDPDYKRMEKLLVETAEDLGMDAKNIPITNDVPDKETQKDITDKLGGTVPDGYFDATRFFMEDEKYIVEVDTSNTARVDFKVPVELPEEYNFTYYATYDETYKVAEYLKDEFAAFIGMKDPMINVSGGDFNIYGEQSYRIAFYEKSSDGVQAILNYHFNTLEFYCNDDGALFLARKYETDLSEVVGDYPIVDGEEALALLEAGNYVTSVPQEFAGKEHVKKMELVYRLSRTDKLFMPYYKFYVELPDMKRENGLNSYGAYYVPAVEEQYIENMPVWDGSFN